MGMIKIFGKDLWNIVKTSFAQYYNNFVYFILVNIIWLTLILIITFAGFYGLQINWFFALLIPLLLLGPVFLTGMYVLDEYFNERKIDFKKIWNFIKNNSRRGIIGFLSLTGIYLAVVFDFYYFFQGALGNEIGIMDLLSMGFGIFLFYILTLMGMMELYFWGFMIFEKNTGLLELARRSLILTLENVLFSLGWLVLILLFLLLIIFSGFFLPILFPVLIGLIVLNGSRKMIEINSNKF